MLEILFELSNKENIEKRPLKIRDLEEDAEQSLSCNHYFAYFLVKISFMCNLDDSSRLFVQEATIIICLLRKFLNEKGYELAKKQNKSQATNPLTDYCSGSNNHIEIITYGLSQFYYEIFPYYLSNILR